MMEVEEKIYNIAFVLDDIKHFPQTYNSILKNKKGNKTLEFILRRKLGVAFNEQRVCKTKIPGTRFGKVIFFCRNKKYNILVEAGRLGSNVYVFFESEKIKNNYLSVTKYWILEKELWVEKNKEKVFHEGNVLLFI